MKRSRFSEEQIIAVLKEQEAGLATVDVCRRHGISSATFYKWKSKYVGLEMTAPHGPNQRWSLDFVSDAFACGRRFRILPWSMITAASACA